MTSFLSLLHHVVEHVDDVALVLDAVLGDLVDGCLELLVVPDDIRDVLVDVMHVLGLLLLLDVDIPCYSLFVLDVDIPLSSVLSSIVPIDGLCPQ